MRRPRLSSRAPIEAAAKPLPKEETTPPVTKMKRHASGSRSGTEDYSKPAGGRARVAPQVGARSQGQAREIRNGGPLPGSDSREGARRSEFRGPGPAIL